MRRPTAVALEPSVPAGNPRALLLTPRSTLAGRPLPARAQWSARRADQRARWRDLKRAAADANGDRIIARFTVAAMP
jgi:hypothetical protein